MGVKYPQSYFKFKATHGRNFNGYTHVFEVHLFNGVVDNITGSCVIPKIDMAAAQTEATLSQYTVVEPGDIENMGIAVKILLLRALELKIRCEPQMTTDSLHTSGFCATIFDFGRWCTTYKHSIL